MLSFITTIFKSTTIRFKVLGSLLFYLEKRKNKIHYIKSNLHFSYRFLLKMLLFSLNVHLNC